jgi:glutathione S-transferase
MKLYYSPGACSLAAHIALREAERSFELVRVDLHTNRLATGEDYRLVNPKLEVPALQLDGPGSDLLTESVAVLLYIADLAPDQHLAPPAGTFARYHALEMLSYLSTSVHAEFSPLFHPETPSPVAERHRGKIGEAFLYLQQDLEDKGYLLGETFTVADCYLFPMLRWCDRFGMSLQIWPNLDDYYHRVVERPTVQAALGAEGLLAQHRMRRSA